MPTTMQHLSLGNRWVRCTATVRPCPRTQHRISAAAEEAEFMAAVAAQMRQRQAEIDATDAARVAQVSEAAIEYLKAEGDSLEFPNHAGDEFGDWVTLADMGDVKAARNNCWAATSELIENADPTEFGGDELAEIELEGNGVYHAALSVLVKGEEWCVVDYTARQFDQGLPFPYVGTRDQWRATIQQAAKRQLVFTDDDAADEAEGDETL